MINHKIIAITTMIFIKTLQVSNSTQKDSFLTQLKSFALSYSMFVLKSSGKKIGAFRQVTALYQSPTN